MFPNKALANNIVIPKPMIEWIKEESEVSKWNSKGIYAIIRVVTLYE